MNVNVSIVASQKNLLQLKSQCEYGMRNHKLWTLTHYELKASVNCSSKDHCKRILQSTAEIREAVRTPSNVERSSGRETFRDNVHYTTPRHLERSNEGLERGGSHAEKHQDVND
jgi:hypothetical protein